MVVLPLPYIVQIPNELKFLVLFRGHEQLIVNLQNKRMTFALDYSW